MATKIFSIPALVTATATALAIASCTPGPRTVENPIVNYANTATIDISAVEMNDSNTILHISANYRPGYWIRIAGDTYLQANGKQYAITGAEGIQPDSLFWMPESGHADFKLTFEPLPLSTERFDFIEGKEPGAFTLWDVDITGNPVAEYPDGLPKEFQLTFTDGPVPAPAFEMGRTTINFHMLPYRPDFAGNYNLYVNTFASPQEEIPVKFDENGNATVSFDQYATAPAFLVNADAPRSLAHLTLYPGETIDCYIDMRATGFATMKSHRETCDYTPHTVHNGRYSNFDRMRADIDGYYGLNLFTGRFADYHMSGKQYLEHVKNLYEANADSIAALDKSQMEKEYHLLRLQSDVIEAISNYRDILAHNYCFVSGNWNRRDIPRDSITATLTQDDLDNVATWFDAANPRLYIINSRLYNVISNDDLTKSVSMYRQMSNKARIGELQSADIDSLKTLPDPFFAAACDTINQRAIRECLRLQELATVTPTPDVAPDKVFDAIIAPHRGKVVMVDLWNTWCGPCRAALKQNEPLKESVFAGDDVVWIYIADESSEQPKYLSMLPEISGIHYKVTSEQIAAIRDRFKVDGIPYYILVDRNGKAEGRPDLRDHNSYIKAIKAAL